MALVYGGRYSDGRSAARHRVAAHFDSQALRVVAEDDGTTIATWDYAGLVLIDRPRRGLPLRLAHVTQPDARLTFDDRHALNPLFARAPRLRGRGALGPGAWRIVALGAAGIVALGLILVYGLPRAAEPVAALVPPEWEAAIGEAAVAEILADRRVCAGSAGARALADLTDRLTAMAGDAPYTFTVTVADVDDVNAFAVPGGHVVLFRGLIENAEAADEVAGVLAHEIGHVIERHGTEAIVRAAGLTLLLELLIGDVAGLIGLGAEFGAMLLGLSYSRADEAEADLVAVRLLHGAGIRVDGLARFFERLAAAEGAGLDLGIISTHPASAERAAAVREMAAGGGPAMSQADWRALRSICG